METLIFLTVVCTVINVGFALYILQLRRQVTKSQRAVKHLSRSIQKLNSKNGHLWYQLAQTKAVQFETQQDTQTGMTITKL